MGLPLITSREGWEWLHRMVDAYYAAGMHSGPVEPSEQALEDLQRWEERRQSSCNPCWSVGIRCVHRSAA